MKQLGLVILGFILAGLLAWYWGKPMLESDYDRIVDSLHQERRKVELKIQSQDSIIQISEGEIDRLEGKIDSYKAKLGHLRDYYDKRIHEVQQENLDSIIAYFKHYYNTDQVIKVQKGDTLYIGFIENTVRKMRGSLVKIDKLEAINGNLEAQLMASDSLIRVQNMQFINKDSMINLLEARYGILFEEVYECDQEIDFQKQIAKKFKRQRNIAAGAGIAVIIIALL